VSIDVTNSLRDGPPPGNPPRPQSLCRRSGRKESYMRSALLWFIGIPIPLILLLAFCTGHL